MDPEALAKVKQGLPVYIFVGDADPINARLERLTPLVDAYKAAGLDVTLKVYPGGRHEMLNETNRAEVVADLKAWLDRTVRRLTPGGDAAAVRLRPMAGRSGPRHAVRRRPGRAHRTQADGPAAAVRRLGRAGAQQGRDRRGRLGRPRDRRRHLGGGDQPAAPRAG